MAFALSYLRYDLSSLTIFLVRGQTVQDAHPPDKHIVRCDPQVQVVFPFVALSANYDPRFLKKEDLVPQSSENAALYYCKFSVPN